MVGCRALGVRVQGSGGVGFVGLRASCCGVPDSRMLDEPLTPDP